MTSLLDPLPNPPWVATPPLAKFDIYSVTHIHTHKQTTAIRDIDDYSTTKRTTTPTKIKTTTFDNDDYYPGLQPEKEEIVWDDH